MDGQVSTVSSPSVQSIHGSPPVFTTLTDTKIVIRKSAQRMSWEKMAPKSESAPEVTAARYTCACTPTHTHREREREVSDLMLDTQLTVSGSKHS